MVRDCSLSEFSAVVIGFLRSRGVDPNERKFDRSALEELKEMYPDD